MASIDDSTFDDNLAHARAGAERLPEMRPERGHRFHSVGIGTL